MKRSRTTRMLLALAAPVLLLGGLALLSPPSAATVNNPGPATLTMQSGSFLLNKADPDGDSPMDMDFPDLLGPWECNDGIDNDADLLPDALDPDCAAPVAPATEGDDSEAMAGYQGQYECNDGVDQDFDGLIDAADSTGCYNTATLIDNDEDRYLRQVYAAPSFTGSVDAAGNVTITGASFQTNIVAAEQEGVGVVKTWVTIEPEGFPWTGSVNPDAGAGEVSLDSVSITIRLQVQGIGTCYVGEPGVNPMVIDNLTSGTSNGLTGVPYDGTTGLSTVVRGEFGIPHVPVDAPGSPGSCGALISDGVVDMLNLPNTSGNDATFRLLASPIILGDGAIGGTVTETGTGTPLENVSVRARDAAANTYIDKVYTDASGDFFLNLPPGDVKLLYRSENGTHISRFNGGVWPFSAAAPITINASETTDASHTLDPGGSITGTVTEVGTGTPLPGVSIRIRNLANQFVAAAVTDANGQFKRTMADGSYKVYFYDMDASHVSEWNADKPGFAIGDAVVVSGGPTVVDAELDVTV